MEARNNVKHKRKTLSFTCIENLNWRNNIETNGELQ